MAKKSVKLIYCANEASGLVPGLPESYQGAVAVSSQTYHYKSGTNWERVKKASDFDPTRSDAVVLCYLSLSNLPDCYFVQLGELKAWPKFKENSSINADGTWSLNENAAISISGGKAEFI